MARYGRFVSELRRRNVLRAALLYVGAVWALAQGIAQLAPTLGAPDASTRWFLFAAALGFPFWLAFAWFYEITPEGLKRESEVDRAESITRQTGRKLDFWIIGILAVAVVLLLTDRFVQRAVPASAVAASAAAIPEKSIAVLPLANASGDEAQRYFSDGLSENLIIALSQFADLKVIGRTSSFRFRDTREDAKTIGAKLGVAHLLEGSVQHAGDMVRVSAELIRTADGSTLWSQRYDRPYRDLFALQDEIAQAVATALKTRLLPGVRAPRDDRPPSGNLEAYNAYLQGNFLFERRTEADFRKAIDHFTRATQLDPGYARAWAALSRAWLSLAIQHLEPNGSARPAYAEARKAARRALQLAPDMAEAHRVYAAVLLNVDFDWHGAEEEARRGAQLAPDDGRDQLGVVMHALGKVDPTAESRVRQVLAADPLRARSYQVLSGILARLGRYDEAEQAVRKAIKLQPGAVAFHQAWSVIEIRRGDAAAALAAARKEPPGIWQDIALAQATQIGPDRAAADAALANLIR